MDISPFFSVFLLFCFFYVALFRFIVEPFDRCTIVLFICLMWDIFHVFFCRFVCLLNRCWLASFHHVKFISLLVFFFYSVKLPGLLICVVLDSLSISLSLVHSYSHLFCLHLFSQLIQLFASILKV